MGNKSQLTNKIKHIAKKYSTLTKITSVNALPAEILRLYKKQISTAPPEYSYLSRAPHKRADIKKFYPPAKSILICAFNYWNSKLDDTILDLTGSQILKLLKFQKRKPLAEYEKNQKRIYKISRYKMSCVYQKEIKKILKKMLTEFKKINPYIEGRFFVDTSPVMEKPLAVRAGLGFLGKNTLIINPEIGSLFFIGAIALNTKLKPDATSSFKGCQDCNLCIKACPSGALSSYKLNIAKCFSAWKDKPINSIPASVAKYRRKYALGCDICQEVCPYNKNTDTPIVKELEPIVCKLT